MDNLKSTCTFPSHLNITSEEYFVYNILDGAHITCVVKFMRMPATLGGEI